MCHRSFGGLHNCQYGVKQYLRNAGVEGTNMWRSHKKKKELNIKRHVKNMCLWQTEKKQIEFSSFLEEISKQNLAS